MLDSDLKARPLILSDFSAELGSPERTYWSLVVKFVSGLSRPAGLPLQPARYPSAKEQPQQPERFFVNGQPLLRRTAPSVGGLLAERRVWTIKSCG